MESIYNKTANRDYEILEKFEAGISLTGQEVKSIKSGQLNFRGAYVTIKSVPTLEAQLTNAHVPRYKMAGPLPDYNPTRSRRLLIHKKELISLFSKIQQQGLTLVPIRVYTKRNIIKLEFGLARGKKQFDKKEDIKKSDVEKTLRRTLKEQRVSE